MDNKQYSMQDVADAAGVSRSTVSRALRGNRSISDDTRKRVVAAARDMGYQIHPMIAALMSNLRTVHPTTGEIVVAYLSFHRSSQTWRSNWLLKNMFEGAYEQGMRYGFKLQELSYKDLGQNPSRVNVVLQSRGIQGVILGPLSEIDLILDLDWSLFCGVSLGAVMLDRKICCVRHNHFQGLNLAFSQLLKRGYERIGLFISNVMDHRIQGRWTASYLYNQQLLKPANQLHPELWDQKGEADPGKRKDYFQKWLKASRPDAVILTNSGDGSQWKWAEEAGFRVPKDLGIAILSHNPRFHFSGVSQCPRNVGAAAMDLLSGMVLRNESGNQTTFREVILDGEWVEGKSLRPLKTS